MDKKSKPKKIKIITLLIMLILNTFATIYLTHSLLLLNGIENTIRIVVIAILVLLNITFALSYFKSFKKNKKRFYIFLPVIIIYSSVLILSSYMIQKTYSKIDSLSSDSTKYSSSLVTLKDNEDDTLKKLDGTIGIISDTTNVAGNQIPYDIINAKKIKNKVIEYDNYLELLTALINEKVDYAFLPTNYPIMFSNLEEKELQNLDTTTKIVYTEEKSVKQNNNSSKNMNEPFTILLMGVDSETEGIANSSFNGDSLMLVTFNPKTLSSTILSIPRDTYVPITCFTNSASSKITHAAWYGEECMINTIENYTGVTIDYYVKVNFKAVVELVDAIGGVEIDVPYNFCEQDSNRNFGKSTIYVEKGLQTLMGEEALAYARNRHPNPSYCSSKWTNYYSDDIVRGKHQQEVVKAILNKLKTVANLNTVNELLNTISNNMETNMTTSQILSLYNIAKDVISKSSGNMSDLISLKRLGLSYTTSSVYDITLKSIISDVLVYEDSLAEVVSAMKVNLGLEEAKVIKTFEFDITTPYEGETIGLTGKYSDLPNYKWVPNFIGDSVYQSKATASNLGLTVTFKYVTTGSGSVNTVISQSYPAGTNYSKASSLVLTVLTAATETTKTASTSTSTTSGTSTSSSSTSSASTTNSTSTTGSTSSSSTGSTSTSTEKTTTN